MFLVDDAFRVHIPPAVIGAHGRCYRMVDVHSSTLWLAHVEEVAVQEPRQVCRRQILVGTVDDALDLASCGQWPAVDLFVVLPTSKTGRANLLFDRCKSIWTCKEPGHTQTCWRIETDTGMFLLSSMGTSLGDEELAQLAWRSTSDGQASEARFQ